MANTYELAVRYYPHLWNKSRIDALVEAGRLTEIEAAQIIEEISPTQNPQT